MLSIFSVIKFNPYQFKPEIPYIKPGATYLDKWKKLLKTKKILKVGICWASSAETKTSVYRTSSLDHFIQFQHNDNIQLFNLQYNLSENEETMLKQHNIINLNKHIESFEDTAAFISQLDLVITVDTVIAHIAGALGKTTWLLHSAFPEWRFLENNEAPFSYPSMRVFYQEKLGCWDDVANEVYRNLITVSQANLSSLR